MPQLSPVPRLAPLFLASLVAAFASGAAAAPGGITSLWIADFEDGGVCSADGWAVISSQSCYGGAGVPLSSPGTRDCCDDIVCPTQLGDLAIEAEAGACTGGSSQWRLEGFVDTTGLADPRVCFDYADQGASGGDDVLQLEVSDAGANHQVVFSDADGPRTGIDGAWFRRCVDLPAWAEDNSAVALTFYLHSDDPNDRIFLDDIDVQAWCDPGGDFVTAFSEDFDNCSLSAWSVTGAAGCPGLFQCDGTNNLSVENGSVELVTTIDTSALHTQVELCFSLGDVGAGTGESIDVDFDTGSGWQNAWSLSGNAGTDGTCGQVCVNLTDIDPAAGVNPALDIRFELASDAVGDEIVLDDVLVRGAESCDDFDEDGLSDQLEDQTCTYDILPDSDEDGVWDGVEDANHDGSWDVGETLPCDKDSDDDGVADGVEDVDHDGVVDPGETDPRAFDTDGDGLSDGQELGYTTGVFLDTNWEIFVADADDSTTTDPTNPDTDGDGIPDGVEDANQNGRVDAGETDPNVFDGPAIESLDERGITLLIVLLAAITIVMLDRERRPARGGRP